MIHSDRTLHIFKPDRHRGLQVVAAAVLATFNSVLTETPAVGQESPTATTTWLQSLPNDERESILWYADYETGNLDQWTIPSSKDPGGGVLNTDQDNVTAGVVKQVVHTGSFAAEATIRNAIRASMGNKAVRFMRWATAGYDQGGTELPLAGYYSTWMYLPEAYDPKKQAPWDPGDGGWWNVFQFKSNDEKNQSQSVWSMNVEKNPENQQLSFYLYSPINRKKSWKPHQPIAIPIQRWFHVEAFVKVDSGEQGEIEIWLNGESIIRAENVRTSVNPQDENIVWGIGNYTDHIAGGSHIGTATVYFDDSVISTLPLASVVRHRLLQGKSRN